MDDSDVLCSDKEEKAGHAEKRQGDIGASGFPSSVAVASAPMREKVAAGRPLPLSALWERSIVVIDVTLEMTPRGSAVSPSPRRPSVLRAESPSKTPASSTRPALPLSCTSVRRLALANMLHGSPWISLPSR